MKSFSKQKIQINKQSKKHLNWLAKEWTFNWRCWAWLHRARFSPWWHQDDRTLQSRSWESWGPQRSFSAPSPLHSGSDVSEPSKKKKEFTKYKLQFSRFVFLPQSNREVTANMITAFPSVQDFWVYKMARKVICRTFWLYKITLSKALYPTRQLCLKLLLMSEWPWRPNLISSSLRPSECLWQMWKNPLKCCGDISFKRVEQTCVDMKGQPENNVLDTALPCAAKCLC